MHTFVGIYKSTIMKKLLVILLGLFIGSQGFSQEKPHEFKVVKTNIEQFKNLYTYEYNTLVEVYVQTPDGTSKKEIRELKKYIKRRALEIAEVQNKNYKYIVKIKVF